MDTDFKEDRTKELPGQAKEEIIRAIGRDAPLSRVAALQKKITYQKELARRRARAKVAKQTRKAQRRRRKGK